MWEGGVRIYGTPEVFNNFPTMNTTTTTTTNTIVKIKNALACDFFMVFFLLFFYSGSTSKMAKQIVHVING